MGNPNEGLDIQQTDIREMGTITILGIQRSLDIVAVGWLKQQCLNHVLNVSSVRQGAVGRAFRANTNRTKTRLSLPLTSPAALTRFSPYYLSVNHRREEEIF